MTHDIDGERASTRMGGSHARSDVRGHGPGKRTLVEQLYDAPARGHSQAAAAPAIDAAPPALAGSVDAPGSPLAPDVRGRMERLFGANFGAVRVHEGSAAERAGAQAFARGADLHFAPGRFDPHSEPGQALLGHELAHVVQHAEGRAPGDHAKRADGSGDPGLEREADEQGARVARGELARPGAAPVVAHRDPSGSIQRMIERAAPANGSDWTQIGRYLERTLINQRMQTFEQAVEEYLACGLAPDTQVADAWRELGAHRDELGWEATALARIATIRDAINQHKSDAPDHPNKRGITPNAERYETVPQSARSQQVAETLRARLLRDMFDRQYNQARHAFWNGHKLIPLAADDKWSTSFMLAVLVLPSGSIEVAHSGFLPPVQLTALKNIVHAVNPDYSVASHDDDTAYAGLQKLYRDSLEADARNGGLPASHTAGPDRADKNKHKVIEWDRRAAVEKGNPTGRCAAPQVVAPASKLTGVFPSKLQGNGQMALTEVLVRASDTAVTVNDASGSAQGYDHSSPDVPSCLTCQHQLRALLTKLVELRRNVVNLDGVRWDEGERAKLYDAATELDTLIGKGGKLATIVLGMQRVKEHYEEEVLQQVPKYKKPPPNKPIEMKTVKVMEPRERFVNKPRDPAALPKDLGAEVDKLAQLIKGYRTAVENQAVERTAHPEFIEHDDHTTHAPLAALAQAEGDARDEYDANHLEAMLTRRVAAGKMIGGIRYNEEREKLSRKAQVAERAQRGTQALEAREQKERDDNEKIADNLRDQAGKAALAARAERISQTQREDAIEDTYPSIEPMRAKALKDARISAAKHHHAENIRFSQEQQEQSDHLLGLAIQLAQAFDTTIGHQLHLLITGQSSDPTPKHDYSDSYID